MSGLEVTQIDHVSVIISDVECSRRFYRDVLGLKEIAKPRTFDFVVAWFDLGNQQLHRLLKERPDTISPRHFALRGTERDPRPLRTRGAGDAAAWQRGAPSGTLPRQEGSVMSRMPLRLSLTLVALLAPPLAA